MEPSSFPNPITIPFPYPFPSIPTSPICTNSRPWMDSRIWSRLPQRLVDRIVASLPPPAFFRARAVCKRWYGLIFSTAFIELYLQVSPSRHWFIFFKQQGIKNCIYKNAASAAAAASGGG